MKKNNIQSKILRVTVGFIVFLVLSPFFIRISESKTLSHVVLWEHTELLRTKSNTVLKPEIIERNGLIFANYGNVLNVYERSSGKKLFAYVPYVSSDPYIILNIEIHEEFLYAFIIPSKNMDNQCRYYFFRLNTISFDVEWSQKCWDAMTRYFFVQNHTLYFFNISSSFVCCFDCYDVNTGSYKSSIEIPISLIDNEYILANSIPKYNQELNEVWVYYYRNATEENPHSLLEIQRLDLDKGYLIDPILIPIDSFFQIPILGMDEFFPILQRKNLLFAEYYDPIQEKYILLKINTFTKMIDWIQENQKVVQEILSNPSDRSTLYLREGKNAYRKINHLSTNTIEHWEIHEIEEDHSQSQSTCLDHIIATRFIHSVVIFDTNLGKVVWVKESNTPIQYKDVAFIGFSPPTIEKIDQNTYQILYSLDDQIGLVEISSKN